MIQTIFIIIIAFLVFDYIMEFILDWLNSKSRNNLLPDSLKGVYDEEKYKKSQEYDKVKQKLSRYSSSLSFVIILCVLFNDGFGVLDGFVRQYTSHPILVALLFFAIIGVITDIIGTPFSLYGTFVIEEKFGFNNTTIKTYFLDKIKGLFLSVLLGGGIISLIIWIYENTGNLFWLYVWIVISAFSIFMAMFYSNLIVPLFNKQKPLEEGELRTAIEEFSIKAGFKLDNVFVIDGSKRSSKSNAYFTGLGSKKRIVLYDTLIKNHSVKELVAILAHEIGHYKKKHIITGLIISLLQTGMLLFVLSLFIQKDSEISLAISKVLGSEIPSFHLGILGFGLLYSPLSLILGIAMNMMSRKNEYEADRFACEKYEKEPMQEALKKLSVDNLSNLNPHPAYVFFYYSHPPILQRLKAMDEV